MVEVCVCFDDIEELTFVSAESHRLFFRKFVILFSLNLYHLYVKIPTDEDEIRDYMSEYAAAGFPDSIGSVDCVHVAWDKVPAFLRNVHKGKEGYPTRSYEVTVNHRRRILAATKGFFGSYNDKTIVRYDGFVTAIHEKELYADVEYILHDKDGNPIRMKGLYLLCDGGYHKWRCLVCLFKHADGDTARFNWSKMLESLRKDVECIFGILKGRFRILKTAIRFHDAETDDAIFLTCCILHNMLSERDDMTRAWETSVNYLDADGDHEIEDMPRVFYYAKERQNLKTDASLVGRHHNNRHTEDSGEVQQQEIGEACVEVESTHGELVSKLVEHFSYHWSHHDIHWMRK